MFFPNSFLIFVKIHCCYYTYFRNPPLKWLSRTKLKKKIIFFQEVFIKIRWQKWMWTKEGSVCFISETHAQIHLVIYMPKQSVKGCHESFSIPWRYISGFYKCVRSTTQLRLIHDMLDSYDRKAKPTWDNTKPVNVTFSMDLYQILEVVSYFLKTFLKELY